MSEEDKQKSTVKRSNSGEFKKPQTQDIDADGDKQIDSGTSKAPSSMKDEDAFAPQEDNRFESEITKSIVLEMHDIKTNDGTMKVEIHSYEAAGTGMKKFNQYLIKGHDSLGEINCYRRYSEFLIFREFLYNRYPGLYIPPVPSK